MPHLRAIEPRRPLEGERFPFSVPLIRTLGLLPISPTVTFFVGENGSGKSTLLEGIAAAAGLPTVGSAAVEDDPTLDAQRELGSALKLLWTRRVRRGFFLRAEDFFGFAKLLSQMRAEALQRIGQVEVDFEGASEYAKGLARLPARRTLAEMQKLYGANLDANSHGQAFLRLFQSRLVPDGLYILDEPEAALSPQSQLAFMVMLSDALRTRAQFIIATHSPILLGFPGAMLYSCDHVPIERAEYDQIDHVAITRDFLNGRERFLKHLDVTPRPE